MQESCNHLEKELFGKELKRTNSISKEKPFEMKGFLRTGRDSNPRPPP